MSEKPTNPKDAIADGRLPLALVPDTVPAYASIAFAEGALKYGAYNWRITGVRMSVYIAAIRRHLARLQNGEWADPKTGVPHLASVIAGAGIILDARACGKLTDDRPPAAPMGEVFAELEGVFAGLRQMFPDLSSRPSGQGLRLRRPDAQMVQRHSSFQRCSFGKRD